MNYSIDELVSDVKKYQHQIPLVSNIGFMPETDDGNEGFIYYLYLLSHAIDLDKFAELNFLIKDLVLRILRFSIWQESEIVDNISDQEDLDILYRLHRSVWMIGYSEKIRESIRLRILSVQSQDLEY